MIHTLKGFVIVNKAEVDVFMELSCFFYDPTDSDNLISDSSAFSKSSLNNMKRPSYYRWQFPSAFIIPGPSIRQVKPMATAQSTLKVCKLDKVLCSVISDISNTWQPQGLQPTRLLCPWDFTGQNTRVGCHFLLQGIFWTQRLNRGFLWKPMEPNRDPLCMDSSSSAHGQICLSSFPGKSQKGS